MQSPSLISISGWSSANPPSRCAVNRDALFTIIIIYRTFAREAATSPNIPSFFPPPDCSAERVLFLFYFFILFLLLLLSVFLHRSSAADARAKSGAGWQRIIFIIPIIFIMSRRKQAKPQHLKSDEETSALALESENGEWFILNKSFLKTLDQNFTSATRKRSAHLLFYHFCCKETRKEFVHIVKGKNDPGVQFFIFSFYNSLEISIVLNVL